MRGGLPVAAVVVGALIHAAAIGPAAVRGVDVSDENWQSRHLLQRPQAVAFIEGGQDAPCGRFPYMVSLRTGDDRHRCGGILVHKRWVLTAAHCVDPKKDNTLGTTPRIVIGACLLSDIDNANGAVEVTLAKQTVIHDKWNGEVVDGHDIALLKLKDKSKFDPVTLPTMSHTLPGGKNLVVLGWGEGSGPRLQMADTLGVVKNSACGAEDAWGDVIIDSMLCAFSPEGQDVCSGDSGGPALEAFAPSGNLSAGRPALDIAVGITSFGAEGSCDDEDEPSVFTRLSSFRQWIDDVIEGKKAPKKSIPIAVSPSPPPEPPPPKEMATPPAAEPATIPVLTGNDTEAPEPSPKDRAAEPTGAGPVDPEIQGKLNKELFALAKEKESSTTQAAVDELLSAGADPNACCFKLEGSDGCTVLHATTTSDNAVVAAAVTAKGANTEATCNDGQTPLHWAATYNASNVSSALVGAGAKLESRDNDRQTPLHQASKYNAWRVIGVLIGAGADVEAVKVTKSRPLHLAAFNDALAAALLLIEAGADVNANGTRDETPLHVAARQGYPVIARLLVEEGADKEAEDEDGQTPRDVVCGFSCPFDIRNELDDIVS